MKFAFRTLVLQVYNSITPEQMVASSADTEKAMEEVLQMSSHLQIVFLQQFFMAGSPGAQTACVHANTLLAISFSDRIAGYIREVKKLPVSNVTKQRCIGYYEGLEKNVQQLFLFLQTHFEELTVNEKDVQENIQLTTTLTVAQLGVLLRLLVDSGILKTDTHMQVIRYAVISFVTTRNTGISQESLRNKFYSPDLASLSIMESHISNMLNLIKQYRKTG